tara:strand:+ start:37826 stop:38935 length:1110 start_codon:yes stop_codon:yes gene_type:complete
MNSIPFTKSSRVKGTDKYVLDLLSSTNPLSGNGTYTKSCQNFLVNRYKINKVLLTTSCTDALEMAAILCDIKQGDEIIVPSYTFVSTANAFVLRGAKIVFADSSEKNPNISPSSIRKLISKKTKAIVPVHYAGVACEMDEICKIAKEYGLFVIEDAAQAIEASYNGSQLGTIGDLGTFSFHDTKNISSGEGGALLINNPILKERAEIIWEKGTNRSAFIRGEVNKYSWVDIGSSFLPSELNAAYLLGQLEMIEEITKNRKRSWDFYKENLKSSELITTQSECANAHMFYLLVSEEKKRNEILNGLKSKGIGATFHFLPLGKSEFSKRMNFFDESSMALNYSNSIIRLPLYYGMEDVELKFICDAIKELI